MQPIKNMDNKKLLSKTTPVRMELSDLKMQMRKEYDIQTRVNKLLQLSITDIGLDALLEQALEAILSLPWLSFNATGAIFLVENKKNTLVMKAHKGLDTQIIKGCQNVSFGCCLCGKSAKQKRIIFASTIDKRHSIIHKNTKPHGHICVPILIKNQVAGVINIYLKEGHNQINSETNFLLAISHTLASIIQRKKAEKSLQESNRALHALSVCNRALIHAEEESKLLKDICELIVAIGGYRMSMVVKPENDKKKSITLLAICGIKPAVINKDSISWSETSPRGHGTIGQAIRSRTIQIGNDFLTDKNLSPWRNTALRYGFRSAISLPLISNHQFYGVLSIYSERTNEFHSTEVALLKELADDLAFGIHTLRIRQAHQKAQRDLEKSNEFFHKLFSNVNIMLVFLDKGHSVINANPAFGNITGKNPAALAGRNIFDLLPSMVGHKEKFDQMVRSGKPLSLYALPFLPPSDNPLRKKVHIDLLAEPIKNDQGLVESVLLSIIDVTDRVQAEEKLLESYKHLGIINRQISILLDLNKQSGGKNTDDILRFIISSTINLSKATIVCLYRYMPVEEELVTISCSTSLSEVESTIPIKRYPFLKRLIRNKLRLQGLFQTDNKLKISKHKHLKYFLFLPLVFNSQFKGALFLGFDRTDCLTTQELEFYEAFASQSSYVLHDLNIFK